MLIYVAYSRYNHNTQIYCSCHIKLVRCVTTAAILPLTRIIIETYVLLLDVFMEGDYNSQVTSCFKVMYQYDAGCWCSEMGKLIEVAHGLFFSSCTSSLPASMCTYVLVITASWFFKNFASVSLSLSLLINDSSAKLSISHLKGVKLGRWTFCSFPLPGHRLTERSVQMLRLKHRSFIPVFDPVTLMTPPWPWDGVQLVLSESWSVPVGANETEEAINSAGQQLILLFTCLREELRFINTDSCHWHKGFHLFFFLFFLIILTLPEAVIMSESGQHLEHSDRIEPMVQVICTEIKLITSPRYVNPWHRQSDSRPHVNVHDPLVLQRPERITVKCNCEFWLNSFKQIIVIVFLTDIVVSPAKDSSCCSMFCHVNAYPL